MALWATSSSKSCEYLLSTSITLNWGLEIEDRAMANGTALLIAGSPYLPYNYLKKVLLKPY